MHQFFRNISLEANLIPASKNPRSTPGLFHLHSYEKIIRNCKGKHDIV